MLNRIYSFWGSISHYGYRWRIPSYSFTILRPLAIETSVGNWANTPCFFTVVDALLLHKYVSCFETD
uniref:hypothetical protein n=1 Tax=Prevotella sp. TaxID=59823 RepID=UPI00402A4F7D